MKQKELTAEEQVDFEIDFVLNKLVKSAKYCAGKSKVEYSIYSPPDLSKEGMPYPIDELKILEMLANKSVVQIIEPDIEDPQTIKTELSNGMHKVICLVYLKIMDLFTDYKDKHKIQIAHIEARRLGPDTSTMFNFEDSRFTLKLPTGSVATIDFHVRKGETTNTGFLMAAFVEHLKTKGTLNGDHINVTVSKKHIKEYVEQRLASITITDDWLKSTRGNLIKKIPEAYKDVINVGNFDRKLQGYTFSLKLPV